jgi:hypothetical protein
LFVYICGICDSLNFTTPGTPSPVLPYGTPDCGTVRLSVYAVYMRCFEFYIS